jgi:hypothetical protein
MERDDPDDPILNELRRVIAIFSAKAGKGETLTVENEIEAVAAGMIREVLEEMNPNIEVTIDVK